MSPTTLKEATVELVFDWILFGHAPSTLSEGEFHFVASSKEKSKWSQELKRFVSTLPSRAFNSVDSADQSMNTGIVNLAVGTKTSETVLFASVPTKETKGRHGAFAHICFISRNPVRDKPQIPLLALMTRDSNLKRNLITETSRIVDLYIDQKHVSQPAEPITFEIKHSPLNTAIPDFEDPLTQYILQHLIRPIVETKFTLVVNAPAAVIQTHLNQLTNFLANQGVPIWTEFMTHVDAKDLSNLPINSMHIIGVKKHGSIGNSSEFTDFSKNKPATYIDTIASGGKRTVTGKSASLKRSVETNEFRQFIVNIKKYSGEDCDLASLVKKYIQSLESSERKLSEYIQIIRALDKLETLSNQPRNTKMKDNEVDYVLGFIEFVFSPAQSKHAYNNLLWKLWRGNSRAFSDSIPFKQLYLHSQFRQHYHAAWLERDLDDLRLLDSIANNFKEEGANEYVQWTLKIASKNISSASDSIDFITLFLRNMTAYVAAVHQNIPGPFFPSESIREYYKNSDFPRLLYDWHATNKARYHENHIHLMLCELVSNAFICLDDTALKTIGELVDDALEHGEPIFREAIKLAVCDASLDLKTLPLLSGMRRQLTLLQSLRDSGCELICTPETKSALRDCIQEETKRRMKQCVGYLQRHEPIPANVQNYLNTAINWIGNGTIWPEQFWKTILAAMDVIDRNQVSENQVSITKVITERYITIKQLHDDAVQANAFPDSLTDHYDAWTIVFEALRPRAGKIKKENE
jgi:hypothetical protein